MITIVVADDHHNVRRSLCALLNAEPDLRVIGEAGSRPEVTRLVRSLQPDVLVLDLMIGGTSGLDIMRDLTRSSPGTNIVILSMYGNEAYVLKALEAGARGYVLKESTDELAYAVREVAAQRRYLSPPLSEKAIQAYRERISATEATTHPED